MANELILSFEETRKISLSKLAEQTKEMKQHTRVYMEQYLCEHQNEHNTLMLRTAQIIVEENTSFAAAKKYASSNCKVAVLNFANPENPGGGVMNGAMAQEECLCRGSNLYEALICDSVLDDYYQYHRDLNSEFYSDRLIYTPGVTVFKDDSKIPKLLPENEWFTVDVITCAAPYLGQRKYTNKTVLKKIFKARIAAIFKVAILNDVECIILGAFGCGAFKNPPEVVASAFHEVIEENGYGESYFDNIVFAIKSTVNDDPYTPCPNIMAFEKEFCPLSAEENKLRFSDMRPSPITMPSGKVLSGKDILSYLEWKKQNKYYGKQFSILGDSISTLSGYTPTGYNLFYQGENCQRAKVHEMQDAWWGKVIDFFGGELLVNNSWSGSRVTRLPNHKELFPSGCSDERTGGLHIGSTVPDVIIVYLGTNDWANNVEIHHGTVHLDEDYDSIWQYEFYSAYLEMLKKLHANYPLAEIWCCTLSTTYMSSNPSFQFPYSFGGTHIDKYNEAIKHVASTEKCNIIDLYSNNIAYDSVDGSHPNSAGMNTLALQFIRALSVNNASSYIDCEEQKHDFIVAEEYTGGTKYVCRNCCKIKHTDTLFAPITSSKEEQGEPLGEECVMFPSGITTVLYSDTLRFTVDATGETKEFKKSVVDVGRDMSNDYCLTNKFASHIHATFLYEHQMWFLKDNNSTNGTYINGNRIEPRKKYQLASNDEISFAKQETIIFYKSTEHNYGVRVDDDASNDDLIEKRIDNKYIILKLLGKGGYYKTYLGLNEKLNKPVAIKVCDKQDKYYSAILQNIIFQEPKMMMEFEHPAIPKVFDIIEDERFICVVREYIQGVTLNTVVEEQGAQTQEKVIEWAKQLCEALGHLHKHVPAYIYCDMKPSNVILQGDGSVKLLDFGTVTAYATRLSEFSCILGTRGYAAPEQYTGHPDPRSDIYSLGITLHYLLTGADPTLPPFEIRPIREYNSLLSSGLEKIIFRCTQLNPDERFQTCDELMIALQGGFIYPVKKKGLFNRLFEKKKRPSEQSKKQSKSVSNSSSQIRVAKCESGHFYDAARYDKCPHCGSKKKELTESTNTPMGCVYAAPDIMKRKGYKKNSNE